MRIDKAARDRKCYICGKKHIKAGEKCVVNVQGFQISTTQNYSKKCLLKLLKKC